MLDVIIIDDDVVYIFYIVSVQYRPLYDYYLLSGLHTPLLMTHIILCSTKCKYIFKLQYLRAVVGMNGLLVFANVIMFLVRQYFTVNSEKFQFFKRLFVKSDLDQSRTQVLNL